MRGLRVACWVVLVVGAFGMAGCGSSGGSGRTVTVQLDVTAAGAPLAWSGSVTAQDSAVVNGTTPSSQEVQVKSPCDLTTGCSAQIRASIIATAPGPGNTVLAPPFTVCLKSLDTGNKSCETGTGSVTVTVFS